MVWHLSFTRFAPFPHWFVCISISGNGLCAASNAPRQVPSHGQDLQGGSTGRWGSQLGSRMVGIGQLGLWNLWLSVINDTRKDSMLETLLPQAFPHLYPKHFHIFAPSISTLLPQAFPPLKASSLSSAPPRPLFFTAIPPPDFLKG